MTDNAFERWTLSLPTNPLVNRVRETILEWATDVFDHRAGSLYLFGSLVYRNGDQFGPTGDVDLLLQLPRGASDAIDRVQWLERFLPVKDDLEHRLMRVLRRSDASNPLVAVMAVTTPELEHDIDAVGQREFFRRNDFVDLRTMRLSEGLATAAQPCHPLLVTCLAYVQGRRHKFLEVSLCGREPIEPFDGPEPLPKALMRTAAMAAHLLQAAGRRGAEYDPQIGLDLLSNRLYGLRTGDPAYGDLHALVSTRRGARGVRESLTSRDQLLLAELVYDMVMTSSAAAKVAESGNLEFPHSRSSAFTLGGTDAIRSMQLTE